MYLCMYTVLFSIKCRYWSLRLASLSQLLMKVCMWSFRDLPFLMLSHYVFYVWETSDIFLGAPNHCLLHHYIHWWFDCSPWLDLSGLVLIHFPSIYLFLSWYFVLLAYIVLCSYPFTFRVRYFPHIILIHPSIIWYSSFLLFHHWYIHLGFFLHHRYIHIRHPQIHGIWHSLHILHFIHKGMGFHIGIIEPSFHSFFSPYYLSLHYVLNLKTTLKPWHHTLCLITLMWAMLRIGLRALWLWLWWTRSYGMTPH